MASCISSVQLAPCYSPTTIDSFRPKKPSKCLVTMTGTSLELTEAAQFNFCLRELTSQILKL